MKRGPFGKIKNIILIGFAALFLLSTPACIVVTSPEHRDHQWNEKRRREEERRREAERRRHERERERHGHHR